MNRQMSNGGLGKNLTCLRGSRNKSVKKSRDFFLYFFCYITFILDLFQSLCQPLSHITINFFFYFQQKKMKIPAVLEAIEISAEKARNLIK